MGRFAQCFEQRSPVRLRRLEVQDARNGRRHIDPHSADDRRVVPRETHDDVEIAFRLVPLAQSGDAVCVDGQAMTLYKTRLRRWMYQRSIN
jgi:hypothetical protein